MEKVCPRNQCILALLLILLGSGLPGLAGTFTEQFTNYHGMDPDQTDAEWNSFDQRLELPMVESFQLMHIHGMEATSNGLTAVLYSSALFTGGTVYLNYLDPVGNPIWPRRHCLVLEIESFLSARLAVGTGGVSLVAWRTVDAPSELMLQRFDGFGSPAYPTPIQVNLGSLGSSIHSFDVAAHPDGDAILAWSDQRAGGLEVFAQRLDPAGLHQWPGDAQVQPLGTSLETLPLVEVDSSGQIFVVWSDEAGIAQLRMTRLNDFGTPAWDPGVPMAISSTQDQERPDMTLLEGQGLLATWVEDDGVTHSVKAVLRSFTGTTPWADDLILALGTGGMFDPRPVPWSAGQALVTYANGDDQERPFRWQRINLAGSLIGPARMVEPPPGVVYAASCWPAGTADGGMLGTAWGSNRGLDIWLTGLSADGAEAWGASRRIPGEPGVPRRSGPIILPGQNGDRSFATVWTDARDGELHLYAQEYIDLQQTTGWPERRLDPFRPEATRCRPARAADGSTAVVWQAAGSGSVRLMLQWFSASWTALIPEPVEVVELDAALDIEQVDLVIDAAGRAVIGWVVETGPQAGVYLQRVALSGAPLHPAPIRGERSPNGSDHLALSLGAFADGSVGVVWTDERSGTEEVYAQRITVAGDPAWPSDQKIVFSILASNLAPVALVQDGVLHTVCVFGDGGHSWIRYTALDSLGGFVHPETDVSLQYDGIFGLSLCSFQDDLVVAWTAVNGTDQTIRGQRISGGTELWTDPQLTARPYAVISTSHIIQTGPDRLTLTFAALSDDEILTLGQEMNGSALLSFGNDVSLIQPEPQVWSVAVGVSARCNPGDPVHWASLSFQEELQGGRVSYFLSNDGGASWHLTGPGLPVVFPMAGTDLRWGADLYADLWSQQSPRVTRVDVEWNEEPIAQDLVLNQDTFRAGETFRLERRLVNSGAPRSVEEYVVLEVAGDYWFWPSWNQTGDNRIETLATGLRTEMLLDFVWPTGAGSGSGLRFWGGLVSPGTADLLGPIDMVEFGFL